MRALVCLWLVACWRDAAPREPQPEAAEPQPAPASRVVHVGSPQPTDKFAELVAGIEGYVDQMCQCADSTCAYAVANDMQKWGESLAKDVETRKFRPTADEQNQLSEMTKRLTDCMMKAMQVGSGSASPTP